MGYGYESLTKWGKEGGLMMSSRNKIKIKIKKMEQCKKKPEGGPELGGGYETICMALIC